ncbi:MAG: hypothetical protein ACLPXM_16865, partial [Terriglobales bacterium]
GKLYISSTPADRRFSVGRLRKRLFLRRFVFRARRIVARRVRRGRIDVARQFIVGWLIPKRLWARRVIARRVIANWVVILFPGRFVTRRFFNCGRIAGFFADRRGQFFGAGLIEFQFRFRSGAGQLHSRGLGPGSRRPHWLRRDSGNWRGLRSGHSASRRWGQRAAQ